MALRGPAHAGQPPSHGWPALTKPSCRPLACPPRADTAAGATLLADGLCWTCSGAGAPGVPVAGEEGVQCLCRAQCPAGFRYCAPFCYTPNPAPVGVTAAHSGSSHRGSWDSQYKLLSFQCSVFTSFIGCIPECAAPPL